MGKFKLKESVSSNGYLLDKTEYLINLQYKFYRTIGGDAVGMSTVPEVIVARHSGMEIFGMSVITNQAKDLNEGMKNDGDDVVKAADAAAEKMSELFERILRRA